jgi:peptide/nickel transport system permease protein
MNSVGEQIVLLEPFQKFSMRQAWPLYMALLFAALGLMCFLGFIGQDWTRLFAANLPPSSNHWLGTNSLGQDLYAHLLQSLAGLLVYVFPGALFGFACGLLLGCLSALFVDTVLDRLALLLMDIFEALPVVIVLILLAALLRDSVLALPIIFAMLFWSNVARTVRAGAMRVLSLDCIDAARSMGQNERQLMVWQVLPMLRPMCMALALVVLGHCLRVQMVLGFLGLDQSARPSLGGLLNVATDDALSGRFWPMCLILGISIALLLCVEFLARKSARL